MVGAKRVKHTGERGVVVVGVTERTRTQWCSRDSLAAPRRDYFHSRTARNDDSRYARPKTTPVIKFTPRARLRGQTGLLLAARLTRLRIRERLRGLLLASFRSTLLRARPRNYRLLTTVHARLPPPTRSPSRSLVSRRVTAPTLRALQETDETQRVRSFGK